MFNRVTLGADVHFRGEPGATLTLASPKLTAPTALKLHGSALAVQNLVVDKPLTVTGAGETRSSLISLTDSTLLGPLQITGNISLAATSFLRTSGLETHLRLPGAPRWGRRRNRQVLADETTCKAQHTRRGWPQRWRDRDPDAADVEALYRQIRAGLEASKAAPAAADSCYGEMEMRRLAAPPLSVERFVLATYKWVGGYGVRAWHPLAAYLLLLAVTTKALHGRTSWFASKALTATGAASINGDGGLPLHRYWSLAAFVTRYSISLFTVPAEGLTPAGTFLFVIERFASVTLLGLAVLSLRSRVQR